MMKNKPVRWISLAFDIPLAYHDEVIALLSESGSTGTCEQDSRIIAYFPDLSDIDNTVDSTITRITALTGQKISCKREIIKKENWAENWKQYYAPIHISEELTILPAWFNENDHPGKMIIKIDPGMAFGAGSHETTQIALRLLEKYFYAGASVLDIGAGTGILSIYAFLKNAGRITAVEIDEDAGEFLLKNVRLNNADKAIDVIIDDIKDYSGAISPDFVLLNIEERILRDILPYVIRYIRKKCTVILTGILEEDLSDFIPVLSGLGLVQFDSLTLGEWTGSVCRLKDLPEE